MTGFIKNSGRSLDLDSVEQIVRFAFRETLTTVLHVQSTTCESDSSCPYLSVWLLHEVKLTARLPILIEG